MDDDQLLEQLRSGVARHDPPPDSIREVAIRAYTWDRELENLLVAEAVADEPVLLRDSLDLAPDGGIDGHGHDQAFTAAGLTIELSVRLDESGGGAVVDGVVVPVLDQVTVIHPNGRTDDVPCDQFGRFTVADVARTFAIVATSPDGRTIRTPLIDL